jgi:uncharacterized protein YjbJ (UPF0337 family)
MSYLAFRRVPKALLGAANRLAWRRAIRVTHATPLSATTNARFEMNNEQVKGRVDEAVGKVKEVAGRAVDDKSLEAKGMAQQVGGKVRSTAGDVAEDVKDASKDVDRRP